MAEKAIFPQGRSQMRALNDDCHGTWCHSIIHRYFIFPLNKTLAAIKILLVLYFKIAPVGDVFLFKV